MSTDRLDQMCVAPTATIRDTMEVIGLAAVDLALVCDGDRRLVGTVSDGDVRRALLAGAELASEIGPHAHRDFTAVDQAADRAWVLDLMQARSISQVPVLDRDGRVVGLHVLRELIGTEVRPNVAVIMAGGRGTRLRPLTEQVPKPMLKVAGRPILERLVLHLVGSGIRHIHLSVNYLSDQIEGHFGDGSAFGCQITYLREDPAQPLGTGGPLALLAAEVLQGPDPLLVMNGDLVADFSIADLLAVHDLEQAAVTVGVRSYSWQVPFGVMDLRGNRVQGIIEKPTEVATVNAGVYVIAPAMVGHVRKDTDFPITELVASAVAAGEHVVAAPLDGDWIDVGLPEQLRAAREGEA